MVALMGSVALVSLAVPAQAQSGGSAAASRGQTRQFDIPSQPLSTALTVFGDQSDIQITGDTSILDGKLSQAVRGSYAPAEALSLLLGGTGVTYRWLDGLSVSIERAPQATEGTIQLGPVRVEGASTAAAPSVAVPFTVTQNLVAKVRAGALGDVAQREMPFSSAVVTKEQIEEQAPQKLGDLFAQDASVSDNSGAYTAWSTFLTVRGMDLDWQNSYRIDGKPFLGYTVTLPYEHMEQVELLKGATGFLYGFGAPGGILNYVTKKPTDATTHSISLSYASSSIVRANTDLSGRLGALRYRFDATHEEGGTTNDGSLDRTSFLLALDAKLTDRLTWDFQVIFQDRLTEDTEPTITTRALSTILPEPIENDKRLVGPGNYVDNRFAFGATGLKYEISDAWQVQINFSQSYSKTRRNESILNLQNIAGDYIDDRADYGERYQFTYWDGMVQGRARIAGMIHNIVAGVSWQKQRNDDTSNAVYIPGFGTGNLGSQNTNRYDSVGSFDSLGLYRLTEVTQKSIFASDRLELSSRLSVLAGLRWIQYEKLTWNSAGTLTDKYRENGIVTPTMALMYKLPGDTLAYASYAQSLQQGSIVPRLPVYTNAGEMLNPLMSKQWELGIKKDGVRWSATAALFRVAKTTEYDRSCGTECLTVVQGGESVFQGLELGATVRLGDWWSLGGNLMLLDTEYASGDAAIVGNRVAGSPRRVATAQIAYRVPQIDGLQVQLGAKHTGKTPLRANNTLDIDAYTLVSLGISYNTSVAGHAITLRARANNLLNEKYWLYQYSNYIKSGDPRSFNLNVELHF